MHEGAEQNEGNKPKGPISWVLTDKDVENLLEVIAMSEKAVIDLETTGLNEHAYTGGPTNGGVAARVALAALTLPQVQFGTHGEKMWDGNEPTTYIVPLSHPKSPFSGVWRKLLGRIVQRCVDFDVPIENQNVKFDAKWWHATTGVDTTRLLTWCTQVSSHLLDETRSTRLKDRAPETFGIDAWDDVDLTYPGASEKTDLFQLGEYAARDTYWTWRLIQDHRRRMFLDNPDGLVPQTPEEIEDARLGKLAVWVAMPMVASLTKIEQNGFLLDKEWVAEHLEEDYALEKQAMDTLADMYGLDRSRASTAANAYWFKDLVDRAVDAGDLVVAQTTEKGNAQWDKHVLGKQARNGSETARLILQQRNSEKRMQFMRSWLDVATPEGFIHTTYHPGRVVTGRLSSSDPNMQQVSKSLRQAFIPREGMYIVDLDYSQIELRVAAFVAGEENMKEAFRAGQDLHRLFAARIAGVSPDQVTPDQRQKAKAGNFGLLYEMSAYGFKIYAENQYGVVLTDQEALEVHTLFFEMWPGLRTWHQRVKAQLHRTGQVTSPLGRVRRVPGIWDQNPSVASYAERAGINAPVQGMGSDLMQTAAASIQGFTPGSLAIPRQRLVGTVHDSIVGEVPISTWQSTVAEMKERMEEMDRVLARMGVNFDVPLVADASVGTRWGLSDINEK